jgi:hypothetical protein
MGSSVLAYASQGVAERTGNPNLNVSPAQFVAVTETEKFLAKRFGAGQIGIYSLREDTTI